MLKWFHRCREHPIIELLKHCNVLKSRIYITNLDACLKLSLLASCCYKKLVSTFQCSKQNNASSIRVYNQAWKKRMCSIQLSIHWPRMLDHTSGELWELGSRCELSEPFVRSPFGGNELNKLLKLPDSWRSTLNHV